MAGIKENLRADRPSLLLCCRGRLSSKCSRRVHSYHHLETICCQPWETQNLLVIKGVWKMEETFSLLPAGERTDFLDRLLLSCSAQEILHVSQRCKLLMKRDFVSHLPREVAFIILENLDVPTLLQCMTVCFSWRHIILSFGVGLWTRVHWPYPVNRSRLRESNVPPHTIALEEIHRWRLFHRALQMKRLPIEAPELPKSLESWNQHLDSLAWNGHDLLAVCKSTFVIQDTEKPV